MNYINDVKALEAKIVEIMTVSASDYNRRDLWMTVRFIKQMPAIAHLYTNVSAEDIRQIIDRLED